MSLSKIAIRRARSFFKSDEIIKIGRTKGTYAELFGRLGKTQQGEIASLFETKNVGPKLARAEIRRLTEERLDRRRLVEQRRKEKRLVKSIAPRPQYTRGDALSNMIFAVGDSPRFNVENVRRRVRIMPDAMVTVVAGATADEIRMQAAQGPSEDLDYNPFWYG